MSKKGGAYLDLTLAMIIVGSSVVFGKIIVASFPVFLASGLRFAIATAIIVPLVWWTEKRIPQLTKREWGIIAAMAFSGQFLFTVLLLIGLKLTTAMAAGVITSTTPAAMALVSFVLLRERLPVTQWFGIALAVVGVMAVNGHLNTEHLTGGSYRHLFGNLLVCAAVMGEAFFLLLKKRITRPLSGMATTAILCLMGLVMFLPPALYQASSFEFNNVDLSGWTALLYFGAVFTVVAYIFWFRGVSQVSGGAASVFTAIMPVSAVVLSMVFLGESLSFSIVVGIVCVVFAIFIMAWDGWFRKGRGVAGSA